MQRKKTLGSKSSNRQRPSRPLRKKTNKWRKSAYSVSELAHTGPKTQTVLVDGKPKIKLLKAKAPAAPRTAPSLSTDEATRLQKVLSHAGIASRRKAELLILEGKVTVNGRIVTELGTKVFPHKDKIKVEGKMIMTDIDPLFIALYKPKGVISTLADPEGRPTLTDLLTKVRSRVIPIGRMDYNSEGLILLTNDGDLANQILKARGVPKLYMIKTKGHPSGKDLEFLKHGFFTAGGVVRFSKFGVEQSLRSKSWIKLEVVEGSQLDLRELLNRKGLLVDRIVRTAIGEISIEGMKPGDWREYRRQDFEQLLAYSAEADINS